MGSPGQPSACLVGMFLMRALGPQCLAAGLSSGFALPVQEVEQLRMERLQIDEQLRQIGMGPRPSSGRPVDKEKGHGPDEPPQASSVRGRSYTGRGRGRRGPNYTSGYGTAPPADTITPPTVTTIPPTDTITLPTDTMTPPTVTITPPPTVTITPPPTVTITPPTVTTIPPTDTTIPPINFVTLKPHPPNS